MCRLGHDAPGREERDKSHNRARQVRNDSACPGSNGSDCRRVLSDVVCRAGIVPEPAQSFDEAFVLRVVGWWSQF
jgi:hypothetical protein